MTKLKPTNYITPLAWMNDIGVSSLEERDAYALVYGFTQDNETEFQASLDYIAEWLMCSKRTAIKVMNSLDEKGLVEKRKTTINGVTFNRYVAIVPAQISLGVKNFHVGSEKVSLGIGEKVSLYGEDVSHNNNYITNKENNNIIEEESTSIKDIISYWNTRTQNVFASIRDVVGKRKIELNARIKEIGVQEFYRAIDIALSSDFLKGNNDRGWKMDFDWFVNKSNLNKILEGKYKVTRTSNGNTTSTEHMSIGQKWGQWLDQQGYQRI